jgi:hypothetical protein
MIKKYMVKGIGFGHNFNNYPVDFEISINFEETEDDDSFQKRLSNKARAEVKRKTACDNVSIDSIKELSAY